MPRWILFPDRRRGPAAPPERTRRGARPRDADVTREMLLGAATAVFAERGFAGARVDEIAERAGVNKALIYTHYGDKEGLYRAVLASRFAAPPSPLALTAGRDPRQALEDVIRQHFRLVLEDRVFARLMAWDLLSAATGERSALRESAGPTLDLVAELVRHARETGALGDAVEPELFRTALVALALGYSLQHPAMMEADRLRSGAAHGDDAFVDYACRLLLEGSADPSTRRRRRGERPVQEP